MIKNLYDNKLPYPAQGQANGLAFAVNEKAGMPQSLKVIHDELKRCYGQDKIEVAPNGKLWKTLEHWHRQGVFLLNTALTVEAGNPSSHINYWKFFTREVVATIAREVSPVWLLLGAKAQAYESIIKEAEGSTTNTIIKCDHPAREKYPDGMNSPTKLSGSNIFPICNHALINTGNNPIIW